MIAYVDENRNGYPDPTEPYQAGVIVNAYLHPCNDNSTATGPSQGQCTTDATGFCFISTLIPDVCYAFVLTLPPQTSLVPVMTSTNTFAFPSLQMGMTAPLSDNRVIGGYAAVGQFGTLAISTWIESISPYSCQADGQQNIGEGSANSVVIGVQIFNSLGVLIINQNATSSPFTLQQGSYTINVTLPTSYVFTYFHIGSPATWNDITTTGQGSFVITAGQTTNLRIGIVAPGFRFLEPNANTVWKMYYKQHITWCRSAAVGYYNMTIEVITNTIQRDVVNITAYWDGAPGTLVRDLHTNDLETYWIPHNQIPGVYKLSAVFIDSANQTWASNSTTFFWGVHY
jgi:hypothetical protein